MINTHLCIGGPLDGQRQATEYPFLRYAYYGNANVNARFQPTTNASFSVTTHTYVKTRLDLGTVCYTVLLHEGITLVRAVEMLLEGYRIPRRPENGLDPNFGT
jgi:hypothetical protein